MSRSVFEQSVPRWKLAIVFIAAVVITIFAVRGFRKVTKNEVPTSVVQEAPPDLEKLFSAETLVEEGEFAIFGTNNPTLEIALSGKFDRMPIGKGKCAFCHLFIEGHKQDRCPDLRGLEARSHGRTQDTRYKMFSEKYAESPEPVSGLRTKAKTGGEYILESIYCPNCYVVEGFGIPGSGDLKSEMPVMNHMPFLLSDYEIIAVASYLQAKDTPGDFSKVTAKEDWQNYFKKELPIHDGTPRIFASIESLAETEKLIDPIEVIIEKNGCFVCHRIPGILAARSGLIGPILAMKNTAAHRLASPEYQKAVSEGRAKATTEREYVMESILNPNAFIVPGFRSGDGMPTDYGRKLTVGDLEKVVNFLLTRDEEMVEEEALSSPVGLSDLAEPAN